MRASLSLLLPLLLPACTAPGPAGPEPAGEPSPAPGAIAPRPFTAEEIRLANPPGTVVVHRIERPGAPAVHQVTRFVSDDGTTAGMEGSVIDPAGDPLTDAPASTEATWVELRDHATFPADATVRTEATCEVPAGRFDCWLYTVSGDDGSTSRFWFAKSRPGPPVLLETESGGQVLFRMALLEATGVR